MTCSRMAIQGNNRLKLLPGPHRERVAQEGVQPQHDGLDDQCAAHLLADLQREVDLHRARRVATSAVAI